MCPSIAVNGRLDTIHWRKQVLLALEEALALSMMDTSVPSPRTVARAVVFATHLSTVTASSAASRTGSRVSDRGDPRHTHPCTFCYAARRWLENGPVNRCPHLAVAAHATRPSVASSGYRKPCVAVRSAKCPFVGGRGGSAHRPFVGLVCIRQQQERLTTMDAVAASRHPAVQ